MCIICENRNTELGMLKLNELKYIDCKGCKKIQCIPSLINLKNLNCSNCISLTIIEISKNLIKLKCNNCKLLKEIPQCEQLTRLDCSYCNLLIEIPKLNHLKKLKYKGCTLYNQVLDNVQLDCIKYDNDTLSDETCEMPPLEPFTQFECDEPVSICNNLVSNSEIIISHLDNEPLLFKEYFCRCRDIDECRLFNLDLDDIYESFKLIHYNHISKN
jgi:hypothetical protein